MAVFYQATDVAQGTYSKLLRQDLLWGGLAGLLAGGALTVFFFGYDVLWFRPLATPDFLSSALLGGGEPGAETVERLRNLRIGIFTTLHMTAFTFLGIIFARFFSMRKNSFRSPRITLTSSSPERRARSESWREMTAPRWA